MASTATTASTNGHVQHPTLGVMLPNEVLVVVNGRSIHAPAMPTKNEDGIKYAAAKDARLVSDQIEDALKAITVEYDGVSIEGSPVNVSEYRKADKAKGIRGRKGGELSRTFSLGTILLGTDVGDGMAYQLRVTATGKTRNGTTPVVNFRVEAWRQGGGTPVDLGTIDGDEEFTV